MYIQGDISTGKTSFLINKYTSLLKSGVNSNEILFICSNSFLKEKTIEQIRTKLLENNFTKLEKLWVSTFNGVVYNYLQNNWALVEDHIKQGKKIPLIKTPGLDITQFLAKEIIENQNFNDYNSKINLIHQILRRYTLITHNNLNIKDLNKVESFISESFHKDADKTINLIKKETSNLRSFDSLKQISTFNFLIEQGFLQEFKNIKYLLIDDFDEMTYSAFLFADKILAQVNDFYITRNPNGSTKQGYLCAYKNGFKNLNKKYPSEILKLDSKNQNPDAQKIYENIVNSKVNKLENIQIENFISKTHMFSEIENILKSLQGETSIVCSEIPLELEYYLNKTELKFNFLSGNKKLIDNPNIKSILTLIKLIKPQLKLKPNASDIKDMLNCFYDIKLVELEDILKTYKKKRVVEKAEIADFIEKNKDNSIEKLIYNISVKFLPQNDDVTYLLKSACDFFGIFEENEKSQKDFIIQQFSSIVSNNPSSAPEIKKDEIIVATAQKIADYEIKTKNQLWLDISNNNWLKNDTGTIYNAWVMNRDFIESNKNFDIETEQKLSLEKNANLLRKIVGLTTNIIALSSNTNDEGKNNTGDLPIYLSNITKEKTAGFKEITPRSDQKKVVEYTGGKMAVPAVPGAGKTTIMQALIIKLLKQNVPPEKILVLTYMDSAAKNFLEKISNNCPQLKILPHISTIHSLGFKILLENDNFYKVGLNENFNICDDMQKTRILRSICLKYLPAGEQLEDWIDYNLKAITHSKMLNITPSTIQKETRLTQEQLLKEFMPVFQEYSNTLKDKNLIDYDDLLILSCRLLKENDSIREYYQNKYMFVIEDEAQDSSKIQQELISIISEKHGNLIRCGDVNQAITTTFSNADVAGFKQFIKNNNNVEMTSSGRCSKAVYTLANNLIDFSKKSTITKNAFYDIKMKEVEGFNPNINTGFIAKTFENEKDEKEYIINTIKQTHKNYPDFSIGILVRSNYQIFNWVNFLSQNGINAIARADSLKEKKFFTIVHNLLKVINNPCNNRFIADFASEYFSLNKVKIGSKINTIKNLKEEFVLLDPQSIEDEHLINLWWDVDYWLNKPDLNIENLVLEIGHYYFKEMTDIANVSLLLALIKKFKNTNENSNLDNIIEFLNEIKNQKNLKGLKFFEKENENYNDFLSVEIMTVHKAKGDEFNAVFVPNFREKDYPTSLNGINLKKDSKLIERINKLKNISIKNDNQRKIEQIEEALRLIYVAITRAQNKLYITSQTGKVGFDNKGESKLFENLFCANKAVKS